MLGRAVRLVRLLRRRRHYVALGLLTAFVGSSMVVQTVGVQQLFSDLHVYLGNSRGTAEPRPQPSVEELCVSTATASRVVAIDPLGAIAVVANASELRAFGADDAYAERWARASSPPAGDDPPRRKRCVERVTSGRATASREALLHDRVAIEARVRAGVATPLDVESPVRVRLEVYALSVATADPVVVAGAPLEKLPPKATLDGGGRSRLFEVETRLALTSLELRNGAARGGDDANGGAVLVWPGAYLVVRDCAFVENRADHSGGAIFAVRASNGAPPPTVLEIAASLFARNAALAGEGGGLGLAGGAIRLAVHASSTFVDNAPSAIAATDVDPGDGFYGVYLRDTWPPYFVGGRPGWSLESSFILVRDAAFLRNGVVLRGVARGPVARSAFVNFGPDVVFQDVNATALAVLNDDDDDDHVFFEDHPPRRRTPRRRRRTTVSARPGGFVPSPPPKNPRAALRVVGAVFRRCRAALRVANAACAVENTAFVAGGGPAIDVRVGRTTTTTTTASSEPPRLTRPPGTTTSRARREQPPVALDVDALARGDFLVSGLDVLRDSYLTLFGVLVDDRGDDDDDKTTPTDGAPPRGSAPAALAVAGVETVAAGLLVAYRGGSSVGSQAAPARARVDAPMLTALARIQNVSTLVLSRSVLADQDPARCGAAGAQAVLVVEPPARPATSRRPRSDDDASASHDTGVVRTVLRDVIVDCPMMGGTTVVGTTTTTPHCAAVAVGGATSSPTASLVSLERVNLRGGACAPTTAWRDSTLDGARTGPVVAPSGGGGGPAWRDAIAEHRRLEWPRNLSAARREDAGRPSPWSYERSRGIDDETRPRRPLVGPWPPLRDAVLTTAGFDLANASRGPVAAETSHAARKRRRQRPRGWLARRWLSIARFVQYTLRGDWTQAAVVLAIAGAFIGVFVCGERCVPEDRCCDAGPEPDLKDEFKST